MRRKEEEEIFLASVSLSLAMSSVHVQNHSHT